MKVHFDGETIQVAAHWAVCHECEGEGQVENPAFSNGFTSSEWAEHDEDFHQSYMSGAYDVGCTLCKGNKVVLEVSYFELDEEEAHHVALSELEEENDAYWQRMSDAESRSERAMGC